MAPASLAIRATEFVESTAAIEAIHAYIGRLSATAAARRLRGEQVRDQDFPVELFALRPPRTTRPPLVLLGGMGPLAGAKGFARACAMFGESREIVLLQACAIPDRTKAILAGEHATLVRELEGALHEAIGHVESPRRPIDLIALCNAAHAFLPEVFARMKSDVVRSISLVECVVDELRLRRSRPPLILATPGTRTARIFARRLDEEGIAFREPSPHAQETLTRAIYEGLKALDWETASAAGEAVFGEETGCIVAACTEIPEILELLKRTGSDELARRLARIDVVDPVELALHAGAA